MRSSPLFHCGRRLAAVSAALTLLSALLVVLGVTPAAHAAAVAAPRPPLLLLHGYTDTCFGMNEIARAYKSDGDVAPKAYFQQHGFPDVRLVGYYGELMHFQYDDDSGKHDVNDKVGCDAYVGDAQWQGHDKCHASDAANGKDGEGTADGIEHLACMFAWYVYAVNVGDAAHAGTTVDVLAHSMGGLIVRAALALTANKDLALIGNVFPPQIYVRRVITVATPHDGLQGLVRDAFRSRDSSQEVQDMTVCEEYAATCGKNFITSPFLRKLHSAPKPEGVGGTYWGLIGASVPCDNPLDGRQALTCFSGNVSGFDGTDSVVQSSSMMAMPADIKIMYGTVEKTVDKEIHRYDSGGPEYTHEANTCVRDLINYPNFKFGKVCATAPFYLNDGRDGTTKAFVCTVSCNGNTGDFGMIDLGDLGDLDDPSTPATVKYALAQIAAMLPPPPDYTITPLVFRSAENENYVTPEIGSSYKNFTPDRLGMLRARSDERGPWEAWSQVNLSAGHVALRNDFTGTYVSAENGGAYTGADQYMLRARATSIGPWEIFDRVQNADGTFSLKSLATNKYVRVDVNYTGYNQYELRAASTSIGPWEKFTTSTANVRTGCYQFSCDQRLAGFSYNTQTGGLCDDSATSVKQLAYDGGTLELRWSAACETNWARFSKPVAGGRYYIWVMRQNPDFTADGYDFTPLASIDYYADQVYAPGRAARACVKKWQGSAWSAETCTPWN